MIEFRENAAKILDVLIRCHKSVLFKCINKMFLTAVSLALVMHLSLGKVIDGYAYLLRRTSNRFGIQPLTHLQIYLYIYKKTQ